MAFWTRCEANNTWYCFSTLASNAASWLALCSFSFLSQSFAFWCSFRFSVDFGSCAGAKNSCVRCKTLSWGTHNLFSWHQWKEPSKDKMANNEGNRSKLQCTNTWKCTVMEPKMLAEGKRYKRRMILPWAYHGFLYTTLFVILCITFIWTVKIVLNTW